MEETVVMAATEETPQAPMVAALPLVQVVQEAAVVLQAAPAILEAALWGESRVSGEPELPLQVILVETV